jgi:hypothetical protein
LLLPEGREVVQARKLKKNEGAIFTIKLHNCNGSTNLPRLKILVYLGSCLVFIKIFIIWMLDARGQFQTYLSSLFILD